MNPLAQLLTLGLSEDPRSAKRFVTGLTAIAAVALHDKFGVSLTDLQMELIAGIAGVMMLGSNYLDAAKAKGAAEAAKVDSIDKASAVILNNTNVPPVLIAMLIGATCLFSAPAFAQQDLSDAPVLLEVHKGEPAPVNGFIYNNALHVSTAKRIVACETTLKEVEPNVGLPVWKVVVVTIAAMVVTASVAIPVAFVAGQKDPNRPGG